MVYSFMNKVYLFNKFLLDVSVDKFWLNTFVNDRNLSLRYRKTDIRENLLLFFREIYRNKVKKVVSCAVTSIPQRWNFPPSSCLKVAAVADNVTGSGR